MVSYKFLAIFGLIALAGLTHAEVEEEDGVLVLTDENFEEVVSSHPNLLVEFYAPWCGHCKNLAPEYVKAAASLKEVNPEFVIAKMDATAHPESGKPFGISGFPTLKFFSGSIDAASVKDYDGGRTAEAIHDWVVKKSGPSVATIATQAELDTLLEQNEVVVLGAVDSTEGEQRQALEKATDIDDFSTYVCTTNADIATKYGISAPGVIIFRQFDEPQIVYDGEFTSEAIGAWSNVNNKPLIMTFSQEKANQIFGGEIDVHLLMFGDESNAYMQNMRSGATAAATENKSKMLHIVIPSSEDRILEYFGLTEENLPAIVLVKMSGGMKKFPYTLEGEALSSTFGSTFSDDLVAFEAKYWAGDLAPELKSAEPADDEAEALKTIVGKNFADRVLNSDKDVLLEFYAPWCGHCKSLAPKYQELAESFSDVDSILIAKMDATENEIDHANVNVEGFPTILFFPANDKANPVQYSGERDVAGFTAFLKSNARSFKLEGETYGVKHDEL